MSSLPEYPPAVYLMSPGCSSEPLGGLSLWSVWSCKLTSKAHGCNVLPCDNQALLKPLSQSVWTETYNLKPVGNFGSQQSQDAVTEAVVSELFTMHSAHWYVLEPNVPQPQKCHLHFGFPLKPLVLS